jgi:putative ABC transport system substrate-binding protein
LQALLEATRTLPIVFVNVIEPIGTGFVASLKEPGGNATGFTLFEYGMSAKWLELLKEVAPRVTRVAVLGDPTQPGAVGQLSTIQAAAPSFRVRCSRSIFAMPARSTVRLPHSRASRWAG